MALWIRPNGSITEITPKNGKEFTLEELQQLVGGYIEFIGSHRLNAGTVLELYDQTYKVSVHRVESGDTMIINEEGKLKGLDVNVIATSIYRFGNYDPIVGNAVICRKGEIS